MNKLKARINFRISHILIVLLVGFLVRIVLANFGTLSLDQNTFIAWSQKLLATGPRNFYSSWSDYLPGYLYILGVLAQISKFHLISDVILYKIPAILGDLATGFLIYKILLKLKDKKIALIGASLFIFNPAILSNSTLWGQVDSINSFFSLLSIYLLPINPLISAISLAVATIVKPQAALTAIVILIIMIKDKWKIREVVLYVVASGVTFFGLFLPFYSSGSVVNFVIERISATLNQYPYTAVNAFNFWGIVGQWRPDAGLNIVGIILMAILFLIMLPKLLKKNGYEYYLLSFVYGVSFLFMTRMHERHLLSIFAPLTVVSILSPFLLISLIGFSLTYVSNLYYSYVWINENFKTIFDSFAVSLIGALNIGFLFLMAVPEKLQSEFLLFIKKRELRIKDKEHVQKLDPPGISQKTIRLIFIGVVVFAFVTRVFNLNNPGKEYFDEIYHAFTAKQMLEGNTKAWEWWNPNPEGFAYEWTHPPIAKEGMVLGMLAFGENSFGYRIPGALLGVGSVILIFFITRQLFNDELTATLASAVFALDGLTLVMSRIGMNDSYILFFALASFLAYLKNKNFWSALALGLALASKWSALWMIPIIFVAHFALKKKLRLSYLFFLIVPPLIYISSYFPLFTSQEIQTEYAQNNYYVGRVDKTGVPSLDMFIDMQKQMWWYHTRLRATHPYTSPWWSWPFLMRPIYLYASGEVDKELANIYAIGNPIIFWSGFVGVLTALFFAIREKYKKLGLVVFAYFAFFAPWVFSPRIMFLYHYLPSIPFLAIALGYILRRFPGSRVILPIALLVFIYFYPHYIGLKVPEWLDTSYYWFTSWR